MGTFSCPNRCDHFCLKQSTIDSILAGVLYYPGLNQVEKKLVDQHPKEALLVFKAMIIAEWRTSKVFYRNDHNDESDAFRHFIWAANMQGDIGTELAKKFLDAHEFNDKNPSKAMDLANNRAGLLAAERLQKEGHFSESEIEKAALQELREGTLVVIKPKGGLK